MKDLVLKFLGDMPKAASDQFNKAMELYRRTKGHDVSKLRFYNTLGFSADRLESLLYDLKKANGVTDVEAANAARSKNVVLKKVGEEAAKELDVKDPEIVLIPVKDLDGPIKEEKTEEATSNPSEAIQDSPAESPENIEKEAVQATSETAEATLDVVADSFIQKLVDFNLEDEKYNSIKSFAAEVSNFTGENPKDQKSATLKAFIEDAKKKLL